jgi:biotin transport system substrate-specific component
MENKGIRILQVVISIVIIALLAQATLQLPGNKGPIPITGQTLAVLVVSFFLPARWGAVCLALYVLLGALGLPVFADGRSGWSVLSGGSGGFLIGFIIAAAVVGYLGEKQWGQSFFLALAGNAIGTAIILCAGLLWLCYLYGMQKALEYGWYPFWQGAIIKAVVGALIVWGIHKIMLFYK